MSIAAPAIWRVNCLAVQATAPCLIPVLRSTASQALRLHHNVWACSPTSQEPTLPLSVSKHLLQPACLPPKTGAQRQEASFSTGQVHCAIYSRAAATKKPPSPVPVEDPASLPPQSPARIRIIFRRSTVDPIKGNRLLRQLQHRRVAGTLDTPTTFSPADVELALAWLRQNYPLDEDAAIIARLDREDAAEKVTYVPQSRKPDVPIIDQMKADNIAKAAKAEAERARWRAERQAERARDSESTAVVARREANRAWVQKYEELAKKDGAIEVPNMTVLQRLVPSALVTATVVSLCLWFADQYIPVSRSQRLFPEIPPSVATIAGIAGINLVVWLLWHYPPCWRFLNRHFILVPGYPFASQMICNFFSHQSFRHLVANMTVLSLVGSQLHDDIGRGPFLALYLASGCLSAYINLSVYVYKAWWQVASLGASGAVAGLITCWFTIHLESGITIPFIPASWTTWLSPRFLMCLMIVGDAYGWLRFIRVKRPPSWTAAEAPVDYLSHLAGAGVGIVAGMWMRWTARQREREGKGGMEAEMDTGRLERMMSGVLERRRAVIESNKKRADEQREEEGGKG